MPAAAADVCTLYLSSNRLQGLDGIEQFLNVQRVSAASNCIADLSSIYRLACCQALQELRCDDNPIARLPYYRACIIALLPSLKILDGIAITDLEAQEAARCSRQMHASLDIMLANACNAHKLVCPYASVPGDP